MSLFSVVAAVLIFKSLLWLCFTAAETRLPEIIVGSHKNPNVSVDKPVQVLQTHLHLVPGHLPIENSCLQLSDDAFLQ